MPYPPLLAGRWRAARRHSIRLYIELMARVQGSCCATPGQTDNASAIPDEWHGSAAMEATPGQTPLNLATAFLFRSRATSRFCAGGHGPALTGPRFTPSSGRGAGLPPWRKSRKAALLRHQPKDPGHRPCETSTGRSAADGGHPSELCRRPQQPAAARHRHLRSALCAGVSRCLGALEPGLQLQTEKSSVAPRPRDPSAWGPDARPRLGGAPGARCPTVPSMFSLLKPILGSTGSITTRARST